jgi:hypothetical protein
VFGGWAIYIAFTIFLLRPRDWGTYLVFYVLLVVLLIANGVGCSQSRTIKLTDVPQPIGPVLRSAAFGLSEKRREAREARPLHAVVRSQWGSVRAS